jgi:ABC-type branched-subunit amino acid transport system ATPase component
MSNAILKTHNLSKAFGGICAVKDFSMSIFPGKIRGIIGPNGAGKTTIFNVLSRIYVQDEGTIEFDGQDISSRSQIEVARMGLSRTFQNTRLFSGLNVIDNVKVALDHAGNYSLLSALFMLPARNRQERLIEEKALACLKLLNLDQFANMSTSNLSYGYQRRVEIARALAHEPKVLMLDEPAAGLNPEETTKLMAFIKDIQAKYPHLAILVIEHRMELIMNLCDHIYVQDSGKTIAEGTPAEIQNNPQVLAAYLGEEN